VTAPVTAGPLRLPDYGSASLADVLPAVLHGLGVPSAADHRGMALEVSSRVCVLLVDGLGAAALDDHAAYAPVLSSLAAEPGSRTITSVFPTTTPIALTSLGTGLTPGEHGITGLLMRLPDGTRVNTLALPSPVDLATLQPRPTAFERAAAAGVTVTRVGPRRFDGNGLTQAGLRGGDYASAETPLVRVAAAGAAVRRGDPSLTYVYYGDLAGVSTYAYAAAACSVGNTGTASFDPGLASAFFVIVGNNGVEEGSYGTDSSGAERPEHGLTPLCDRAQNLGGVVCE